MRTVIATAAAVLVALASTADAQPAAPVQWSASDECPSRAELIAEIERLLGGDVDWSAHAALGAVVEASRDDAGWRVVVTTQEPEGFRELRGATCKEVADAAALVLAMLIDPDALMATAEPSAPVEPVESAGDDELPTPPAAAADAATATATERRAGARIRWSVRANVVSDLGALPGVAPGLGLTAAGTTGRWRGELSTIYWFERRERTAEDPNVGGDLSMWAGIARACYRLRGWDGCAGFEAGRFSATGFGTELPRSNTATWLAPTLGAGRELKLLKQLSFFVTADAALALRRPRFTADNVAGQDLVVIHRPAAVVGRVLVGAELAFP